MRLRCVELNIPLYLSFITFVKKYEDISTWYELFCFYTMTYLTYSWDLLPYLTMHLILFVLNINLRYKITLIWWEIVCKNIIVVHWSMYMVISKILIYLIIVKHPQCMAWFVIFCFIHFLYIFPAVLFMVQWFCWLLNGVMRIALNSIGYAKYIYIIKH